MSDKPETGPTPVDFFSWMSQFTQPWLENGAKMAAQMPTAAPPQGQGDPMTMWKEMQQKNEQAWTQFMAQAVGRPEFAKGLGQQVTGTAMAREAVRKAAQAYLEAANMPTREDVTRVAGLVVALDARLDDLEEKLEAGDPTVGLESRLAEIVARLDRLDQQAALQNRMQEMETRQNDLTDLNGKLDRLTSLEDRLSRIETSLERLTTGLPTPETSPTPIKSTARVGRRPRLVPPATAPSQPQEDK